VKAEKITLRAPRDIATKPRTRRPWWQECCPKPGVKRIKIADGTNVKSKSGRNVRVKAQPYPRPSSVRFF
jgi:hypothetical protein